MKELGYCKCGLTYAERPEVYSASNRHPRNFCPECARKVTASECKIELVPDSVWEHALKVWFHPNYVDYPD